MTSAFDFEQRDCDIWYDFDSFPLYLFVKDILAYPLLEVHAARSSRACSSYFVALKFCRHSDHD